MRKLAFFRIIQTVATWFLLARAVVPAFAEPFALPSIGTDYGTYVVSGAHPNSNQGGTPYSDTNFYLKGAMMISAPVANVVNGVEYGTREMEALFSFNTASVAPSLDLQFGPGKWAITSIKIVFYSNYYSDGQQANNPDFNKIAAGDFQLSLLGSNPDLTAQTWNTLQAYLPGTTVSPVGTFHWATGTGVYAEYPVTYALAPTPNLTSAITSGEISLLGVAADDKVGFLFNTNTKKFPPQIVISADLAPAAPPPPVDGVCGPSSGGQFDTAPSSGLCNLGASSALGSWNWTCSGIYGGTAAACSAELSSYPLTVTVSGNGSIHTSSQDSSGIPGEISCTSANSGGCSSRYPYPAVVAVTATPQATSIFATWGGDCTGNGACLVTMDSAKNISATFVPAPLAWNFSTLTGYPALSAALVAALPGEDIRVLGTQQNDTFTLTKDATLSGGWDALYQSQGGQPTLLNGILTNQKSDSTVKDMMLGGKLTISGGSLRVNRVTIGPSLPY